MPTFEIEQYEIHVQKYRVEATSEADAIAKLFGGEADPVDNSLEFIEVCDNYGLPTEEYHDLAADLRTLGVEVDDDVIQSIRSIQQVW